MTKASSQIMCVMYYLLNLFINVTPMTSMTSMTSMVLMTQRHTYCRHENYLFDQVFSLFLSFSGWIPCTWVLPEKLFFMWVYPVFFLSVEPSPLIIYQLSLVVSGYARRTTNSSRKINTYIPNFIFFISMLFWYLEHFSSSLSCNSTLYRTFLVSSRPFVRRSFEKKNYIQI